MRLIQTAKAVKPATTIRVNPLRNRSIGIRSPKLTHIIRVMRVSEVVERAAIAIAIGTPNRANWEIIIVFVRVGRAGNVNLMEVTLALRQSCLPLGRRQRRQQQRRKNG